MSSWSAVSRSISRASMCSNSLRTSSLVALPTRFLPRMVLIVLSLWAGIGSLFLDAVLAGAPGTGHSCAYLGAQGRGDLRGFQGFVYVHDHPLILGKGDGISAMVGHGG